MAWRSLGVLDSIPDLDLARAGQRCENHYLGVQSGIMDQIACLCGVAGHALLVDCRDLETEAIAVPDETVVVVFDSGVRRRLSDAGGFNDRRAECVAAVAKLRRAVPGLLSLRELSSEQLDNYRHLLSPTEYRRARHTVDEIARVVAAGEALRHGDLNAVGQAMFASHASSRQLYEVSVPELDVLVDAAAAAEGCPGARLMGGGFGGCVAALATTSTADDVAQQVGAAFASEFGRHPTNFCSPLAAGTRVLDMS